MPVPPCVSLWYPGTTLGVTDYNGDGQWTRDAILERYARYCDAIGVEPLDLSPFEHVVGSARWVYPVMHKVIEGIEQGDDACKLIGVEFIEEDRGFPFGMILKYQTARALRRTGLTEEIKERIRRRVIDMLAREYLPRELREYLKLLRKVGLGQHRADVERLLGSANKWVARYARYLLAV